MVSIAVFLPLIEVPQNNDIVKTIINKPSKGYFIKKIIIGICISIKFTNFYFYIYFLWKNLR